MLPRRARLSTEEFKVVMEKGRVFNSPLFLVRLLPNMPHAAFSAVASKKVAKTAVIRNKIRRQIYAAVVSLGKMSSFAPVHGLIFAKDTIHKSDPASRSAALREVFVKAGIMK